MGVMYEKSRSFAIRIVKLHKYLTKEKGEYDMSKQLLRCGTSIGANLAEAQSAISKNDFFAKLYIAFKEANETIYWLSLLHDTDYLTDVQYASIMADASELSLMLSSATKTISDRKASAVSPNS